VSGLEDLLRSRSSFVLAALAVSWIAVVLLALIAANLHFRLVHLERSLPAGESRAPFGHLLGRSLVEVLGPRVPPATRLAFVLASDCSSCERILAELGKAGGGARVALLWRDATPSLPPLPPGVTVLDDGPRVSRELGVGVAPFALSADPSGRIARATPVGSVDALADLLSDAGLGEPLDRHATPVPQQPLKGVS
jgi:hypothetical protein